MPVREAVCKDREDVGNDAGGARSPGVVKCAKKRVSKFRVCWTTFCAVPAVGAAGRGRDCR